MGYFVNRQVVKFRCTSIITYFRATKEFAIKIQPPFHKGERHDSASEMQIGARSRYVDTGFNTESTQAEIQPDERYSQPRPLVRYPAQNFDKPFQIL